MTIHIILIQNLQRHTGIYIVVNTLFNKFIIMLLFFPKETFIYNIQYYYKFELPTVLTDKDI